MKIEIDMPITVFDYLLSLTALGLYGATSTEVAKRLIEERLRELIRDGVIKQ